jgi:acyl-CoA hydrolase
MAASTDTTGKGSGNEGAATDVTAAARRVSLERAVDLVIEKTGGDVRLGLPLGLGKPNQLVNALYQRVKANPQYSLSIFTALSLGRPKASSELERRFLNPFVERIFSDYPELDYLTDLRARKTPDNIEIYEFFVQPASMLGNEHAQHHYISCNYTHAVRDIDARGVNVVAQLVAYDPARPGKVSLSCNPEISLDLLPRIEARRENGESILIIGQSHPALPYMPNDAEVSESVFDFLIDDETLSTQLFSTPNMPVSQQDHFVGLYASTLVADDGLLQIGIGALGDALVHHLLMRHHDNGLYHDVLSALGAPERFADQIARIGSLHAFKRGLYGCSEMVTAGMLGLMDGGVISRPVLDDADLFRLLEQGRIGEQISLQTLDVLLEEGMLSRKLTQPMLDWLCQHGILKERLLLRDGRLNFNSETIDAERAGMSDEQGSSVTKASVVNDLEDRVAREALKEVLGGTLRTTLLHGGFFLGPLAFYRRLAGMSDAERSRINMTRISFVNDLFGDERLKRMQRRNARFINTAFSATLLGAGIADALESGQVLSGVGGQYNFVAQAHELDGARSIIMLRAWRQRGGEASSNIVWSYGHTTIPRHLRDVFVTEYGIADLRGKTDAECVAAMLNIADSRFQADLLDQAKSAGKIAQDYVIPAQFSHNLPQALTSVYESHRAELPAFPLGSDFTQVEQALLRALTWLKEAVSSKDYLELGRHAMTIDGADERYAEHLARMALVDASSLKEKLYRRLLLAALSATDCAAGRDSEAS